MRIDPEPTRARLQEIRALIDKGEYPVDLDVLARRIVDDELLRSGSDSGGAAVLDGRTRAPQRAGGRRPRAA